MGRDGQSGFVMEIRAFIFSLGLAGIAGQQHRLWRRDQQRVAAKGLTSSKVDFPSEMPLVSVLVPAWNEAHYIEAHIEHFKRLTYPQKELILCVGGDDGTFASAEKYANDTILVLHQQAGEGKQRALEHSLEHAKGTIIFLTDADCLLDDNVFERTLHPIICAEEVATTGGFSPFMVDREKPFVRTQWYIDTYARSLSGDHVDGLIGRNAAIRRDVLERVGGFSDPVKTGTDYYLAQKLLQAGVEIRFVPDSIVETEYKVSASSYIKQQSRWLRNIILHGREFGSTAQIRNALLQCGIGAGMLCWPLTWPLTGLVGVMLWLWLFIYGVGSRLRYLAFSQRVLKQPRRLNVYILAPVYFLLDQTMLAYTLLDLMLPNRRWRW